MLDTAQLAKKIRAHGYITRKIHISDDPQIEDDSIDINDRVHIQVGDYYAAVNVETEGGFSMGKYREADDPQFLEKLLSDLKEAI